MKCRLPSGASDGANYGGFSQAFISISCIHLQQGFGGARVCTRDIDTWSAGYRCFFVYTLHYLVAIPKTVGPMNYAFLIVIYF